jgi:hypothetical protein
MRTTSVFTVPRRGSMCTVKNAFEFLSLSGKWDVLAMSDRG